MASIELIKASDGSANANIATVQNARSSGSSTIVVDTVAGINPDGFAGSMGTPHTFIDPVTSEEITVISEATAVDFSGHVDGSNLEIDDIAPGYVDGGSEVGDIIIIRPTTQWSDNVAGVLEVVHNDDGTLKANSVLTETIPDDAVTAPKIVGIDKSNLTTDSNPYKFHAWASALTSLNNGTATTIAFATEEFDTNNNFSTPTYTAPVAGFYRFDSRVQIGAGAAGETYLLEFYKNGAVVKAGDRMVSRGADTIRIGGSTGLIQLAASDAITVIVLSGVAGKSVAAGQTVSWFSGILECRT